MQHRRHSGGLVLPWICLAHSRRLAHSRAMALPAAGNRTLCSLIEEGLGGLPTTLGPAFSRLHGSNLNNLNVRNLDCPCSSCFTAVKITGMQCDEHQLIVTLRRGHSRICRKA